MPKEIVGLLRASRVLSWKVMWFEQRYDGSYSLPASYPRQSSAITHDLPTLSGFLNVGDFALGEKLKLYPDKEVVRSLHEQRAKQKQALLGLQPEDWIGMTMPVNVPGTVDQYPNWRRKLTQPLESIFADKEVGKLLKAVSQTRQRK
nr:4-alpha-glucanotransferase [Candidatus Pantoea persica]